MELIKKSHRKLDNRRIGILLKTRQWIFLSMVSSCLQDPVINGSKEKRTFTCTEIEAALEE